MCMNMYCALSMHELFKCKNEEGNVGASAPFINVKSSDVVMVVDVVRYEEGCL